MGLQTGQLAYLKLSTDGGSTYTKLGKVDSLTININAAEIEAGHFDDDGWLEYLEGKKDATIDFSCKYDESDPGQDILLDYHFDSLTLDIEWAHKVGTGNRKYTATAIVTSLSPDFPDNDVAMITGTLRITSKPTPGTQT